MAKVISGLSVAALVVLTGCGGSGGSLDDKETNSSGWKAGVYNDSDDFKNKCESPRSGRSQITNLPFPDQRGSAVDEKNFLRSWSHETYLWYRELPDINPANSDTPQKYFEKLKTNATTSSGKPKDNFHFYEPTEDAEAWQAGITYGYGIQLKVYQSYPPRRFYVSGVEPGSPAASAGIKRGDRILAIDDVDLINDETTTGIDKLNSGLFPDALNEAHKFKFETAAGNEYVETLQSSEIDVTAVPIAKIIAQGSSQVGYIQFNTFIPAAQDEWIEAINNFKQAGVDDLIVDMRYNGGGYISVASMVSYMIGGSNVSGKTFFQEVENDKAQSRTPLGFTSVGLYETGQGNNLPTLNFNRVYVLSTKDTCSASELVINGLRGAGVEVYLIGDSTCGKPYGFTPEPNCGTTYYTIQLTGVNAEGFGEYSDGFVPSNSDNGLDWVKGCKATDNINYELGETNEPLLAVALNLRETGGCNINVGRSQTGLEHIQKSPAPVVNGKMVRSPRDEIAIFDL